MPHRLSHLAFGIRYSLYNKEGVSYASVAMNRARLMFVDPIHNPIEIRSTPFYNHQQVVKDVNSDDLIEDYDLDTDDGEQIRFNKI